MSKPGGQSSSSDYWPARDDDNQPANAEHNPHKWAVGTTFEWEFEFPITTNSAYGPKSASKRKAKKPANPKATPDRARKTESIREAEASAPHARGTTGTDSGTRR